MELKYATGQDAMNCWILDYKFLETIQEDIEVTAGDGDIPSLIQIEETLLSFERLSKKV